MQDGCEGMPKNQHFLYLLAKDEAFALARGFPMLQTDFVETLAMVFEESDEISGGRAAELMGRIVHLLKCRKACFTHHLMREVLGLEEEKSVKGGESDGNIRSGPE